MTQLQDPSLAGVPTGLLIDGEWVSTDRTLEVDDPATGTLLAEVSDATVPEALAAVAAAHEAFGQWAATAPRSRAEVLRRAYEIMSAELEQCARLIVLENGKAWSDAMGEATYAAEFFRWFSEEASRVPGDFRLAPNGDKTIIVDHQPMGVAYMITPWNFPAAMATRKLAPALAAGCTAVLKPAAETPLTALWVAEVLRRAGVPAGVVNVVTTSEPGPVSEAVLADRRTATLSFTGSTPIGKLLLAQTATRALPSSMELGGNAPLLVLEGADVDKAVEGAMVAKMRNGGSACTAANRFYVHESLATEFTDSFERALGALRIGSGLDPANDLGALVSTKERDKVLALVAKAADEGGRPGAVSEAPATGAFISPYVVRDVVHGQTLTREEIFGPVAPIVTVESTDEAVAMANDTDFGLISYVFAADAGEGIRVARRMESGMVAVNRGVASDPAAPFGGMKESGLGREGGFAGIHEFLETKYLAVDL
ncbi:NAD-dependent succinate-semialdehyde dehydrogenase [Nocardioides ganghwensis]|uniref:NAD-dependent succinate-semialdehyde dehydrogenase n=1 Tax=Nocardioides ganghwensis TaxID=252230 RepID=A0A4Q2SH85_9ACTN|nr:NAD-dependent succinate-semialdehyde dehydrogenase [Nocardioides ganghwensis]MBD3946524.1 NAD-dependent succinate-semialdehyde dehydrogenase [Nocardioides ganghwensis]RYC03264.1 NAD-dependent succinate-semialdehyde dehydrogenase [Nocardioides ganghwensis]